MAAAATAATLVVIAADAKSCLLNSGNGNANSHTKGQSVRGAKERESGSVETEQERVSLSGAVRAQLQMCKSN